MDQIISFAKLLAVKQITFKDGEIALLDQSVGIIPLDYLVTLQKNLEDKKIDNLLYYVAKDMGVRWFRNMNEHFKIRQEDVIRWGINTLSVAGWGETSVIQFDVKNQIMKVHIKNASQSKKYGPANFGVDSFVRGCYASGAKVLFNEDCDAIEFNCRSQGSKFCEFIAQPTKKFERGDPIVKRQLDVPWG